MGCNYLSLPLRPASGTTLSQVVETNTYKPGRCRKYMTLVQITKCIVYRATFINIYIHTCYQLIFVHLPNVNSLSSYTLWHSLHSYLDSSRLTDGSTHPQTRPSLVRHQAIIWTKAPYCYIDCCEWIPLSFETEYDNSYSRKCVCKCHLQNGGYFVQGLYSLSGKTSYRQISWSLEAARLGVIMIVSLWNLAGISAALPRCLSNFRAIWKV